MKKKHRKLQLNRKRRHRKLLIALRLAFPEFARYESYIKSNESSSAGRRQDEER